MNRKLFLPACILFVMLISCNKESHIESFKISYVYAGFNVNYYSATLDETGAMQVLESNYLSGLTRENSYRINDTLVRDIRSSLQQLTTINLKDSYGFGDNKPFDMPVTRLVYTSNIKSDSTVVYMPEENELPEEYVSFMGVLINCIARVDTLR